MSVKVYAVAIYRPLTRAEAETITALVFSMAARPVCCEDGLFRLRFRAGTFKGAFKGNAVSKRPLALVDLRNFRAVLNVKHSAEVGVVGVN